MFISNITEPIPEEEYSNLHLLFESLDATARITNTSMFVIDFSQNKLIYRTKSLRFADEATRRDIQRECSNPYWSLMDESDLDKMLESREAYLTIVENFGLERQLNHTYIIDYTISMKRRSHVVTQKFTPLKLRPDGKLWLGLFCITTSPHRECKHIELFGDDFRFKYDFIRRSFVPHKERLGLTMMERAIIHRASKGMTCEQIANDLCRSVNTIKTHKGRLFDKLHVRSMREAIVYVSNYDIY